MLKKLIALVEALMLVSLFCIGFATWSITDPNGTTLGDGTLDGSIQTQSVESVSLDKLGIGAISSQSGFEYSLENDGTGLKAVFSKTTLTVNVPFNKAKMEKISYTDAYYLTLECVNTTNAVDIFESTAYMTAPTVATAHLDGFPNQKVGGLVSASSTALLAKFHVKSTTSASLYNLVSRSLDDTATLVFTFDFIPNASGVASDYVQAICWSNYKLTFKISAA